MNRNLALTVCFALMSPLALRAEEAPPPDAAEAVTPATGAEPAAPSSVGPSPPSVEPAGAAKDQPTASSKDDGAQSRSPWAFGGRLSLWLPGASADLEAEAGDVSLHSGLIDVSFGGRLEGYWRRLGLYADGTYLRMDIEDRDVEGVSTDVQLQFGLLEYAGMFRLLGPAAADLPEWAKESGPPRLDVYAGGRTIWASSRLEPEGMATVSRDGVLTSPIVGGRLVLDLHPRWSFLLDGNVGGFGVDDVDLAAEGLAEFSYRTTLFGVATAISLGFKVLYADLSTGSGEERIEFNGTFYGPVIGLTLFW